MADLIVLAVVAVIVLPALFKTIKKFSKKKDGKGHDHDCGGGCGCGCC